MGNKVSEESLKASDMILTIETDKTGLLEIEKLDECYKYGYRGTMEKMNEIKEILTWDFIELYLKKYYPVQKLWI